MTGRRDARDDRPVRERRSKAGNAARLAEMAELSASKTPADFAVEMIDRVIAERVLAQTMFGALAVELRRSTEDRDRYRILADLAVEVYEANRAWQLAPEHREALYEAWVVARDRFEVAVAEEVERRGR